MNLSPERLKFIEKVFKQDIKWAITKGPGFNPQRGVHRPGYDYLSGTNSKLLGWKPDNCKTGVCAVGAYLLKEDAAYKGTHSDVWRASRLLKTTYNWMRALYMGVAGVEDEEQPTAIAMAKRLKAYGKQVKKDFKAKQALLKAKN